MSDIANSRASTMNAVIVVGTGYTGRRILEQLPETRAIGLNRSAIRSTRKTAVLDLDAATRLPLQLPEAFDLVYTVPPARTSDVDRRLQRLLDVLDRPPERLVYISTTGVYGNRDGATIDESVTPAPETARAKRRADAEQRLNEWSGRTGAELVILRVPGIYGPGRLGIDRIRRRSPVIAETDSGPGNRIHVDDLAACCVRALSREVPPGVFNVGDGDARSSTWFACEVARQAGLPAPPTVTRVEASRTFSARRMSFLAESRRVDTTKMRDVLGFTPRYANAETGIRASLAAERAGDSPS